MSSLFHRLVYALKFQEPKILLSGDITNESRILAHRSIQERVAKIAPFLIYDNDPYMVVSDGRMRWIVDAYTATDRYPYSQPISMRGERINYIRNSVKVVVDARGNALYFSRSVIPYDRDKAGIGKTKYYKHLGIYAYRRNFLLKFRGMPKSRLEQAEQLEQLRALEAGVKIKTVLTDVETIGVDTPEDLARVTKILR